MGVEQKIDADLFPVTKMVLDFCGYNYAEDGVITSKDSHSAVHGPNWYPELFPKDAKACIKIMSEEQNNALYLFKKDNGALFFVQDELMKYASGPWYMSFPILNFYYMRGGESWFLWREHAMIGKISESGMITAYRISNEIIEGTKRSHPGERLTIENMVKVLGTTFDEPLRPEELEREIPQFVNFFIKPLKGG